MQIHKLSIDGAFEIEQPNFSDHRGRFVVAFQESAFTEAVGHPFHLAQVNNSVSRRGTLRGVHFADTPPGQAKYLYCPSGELLDVIVDIRVGSPTFGRWEAVRLDAQQHRAVYIAEGLGHAFIALAEDTVVSYFCSTGYNPSAEHGISPLDPALELPWPDGIEPILSEKDAAAPTLKEAESNGLLPSYADCQAWYTELRTRTNW